MSVFEKINLRTVIITCTAAVLAIALLACFMFFDELPRFNYKVIIPNDGNILLVTLEIHNPVFSKTGAVSLLIGDKPIEVYACTNASGQPTGNPLLEEGVFYISTGRGSRTYLTYTAEVAVLGKHGNRGNIASNYAMFDGEQALLLPTDNYIYLPGTDQNTLLGEISFEFDLPYGWEQITPRDTIKNPHWADIYAITQDAFVFGEFNELPNMAPGLKAFALTGTDAYSQDVLDGFNNLYAFYAELFGSSPNLYTIALLPEPDADTPQVIGGAGSGSVAASFDSGLTRDWELLSHRMFHAFFDSAAPYSTFHMPSNLWFYEGFATYYENMSMDTLPDSLKTRLDINVNRQFATLFNQYLYMRIKDPMVFGFPPMREEDLALEAQVEFLHYTAAPLLVKHLEALAQEKGMPADSALRFCVENGLSLDERFVSFETAIDLLGEEDAGKYVESYLLSLEVPPLWGLQPYQPSDEDILAALNSIEEVIGSYFLMYDETYHIDRVTYEQLQTAVKNLSSRRASFVTAATASLLSAYCQPVYALLNDYYYRARQKGISYDDIDLRRKMFAEETDEIYE